MNGEHLFRILGLLDPSLIDEAVSASSPAAKRRRTAWRRPVAAAACLALICGGAFLAGTFRMGSSTGGADAAAPTGERGSGHNEGMVFMSYAGPVFPLTTEEADTGLTAERTVTWDFAPGRYEDGSPLQWGAQVSDAYVLTNPTDADVTVTALYPLAGSLSGLDAMDPAITVDGTAVEPALYGGAYAGSFQGVWYQAQDGSYQLDDTTLNLAYPDSWEDYAALLEDGHYLSRALGEAPELDVPAAVYTFSDFQAPLEEYSAATQAVEFSVDPEKTFIFTYGFNGFSRNETHTWLQYSYFVPDGGRAESDLKLLVVLGEDIGNYTLQGYADGGCDQEINGVSCTVTREETTLDAVLDQVCRSYLEDAAWMQLGLTDRETAEVPGSLFRRAVAELVAQYSPLSGTGTDRYSDGRLDDMVSEALTQERVLYLAFPVTVPAGGSVTVSAEQWKEPSFDYGCSGSENVGLQGYDLVTALGSSLEFTKLTAALVHTETIEVVRQNTGFDLKSGISQVSLDPAEPHYYLEIRPLGDA